MRSIELSLVRACPVRCDYCPQDQLLEATPVGTDRQMTAETLENVLKHARPEVVVFAGFTEPTAHPDWFNFAACVRACPSVRTVNLFTTGYKLEPWQVPLLRGVFDSTSIHVTAKTWPRLRPLVALLKRAGVRWLFVDDDRQLLAQVRELVPEIQDKRQVSRASNLVQIGGSERVVEEPVRCGKTGRDRMPVVLPSGLAVACCNDYALELPLGYMDTTDWDRLRWQRVLDRQADPRDVGPCHRDCHLAEAVR